MADLTSLYRNKPKRDQSIQACADCLNKVALLYPNEFKKGKFTDYFDIAGGTQPPKSKFIHAPKEGYVRFLQIRDFASENTPTYIPIAANNKLCLKEDLVLGRYGASVGKILTGKEGSYNVACAKIIFLNPNEIDRDFLFYWLHSSYFQNFLTSISRSAQGGFNKNDLSRVETLFPSLQIQKKFVGILKKIDDAVLSDNKIEFNIDTKSEIENSFIELVNKFLSFINETEELANEFIHQADLLNKFHQSILQETIQGKLVEQNPNDGNATDLLKKIKADKIKSGKKEKELLPIKEEEKPFSIPESWVWCRLGEIAANVEYGTSQKAEMSSEHVPVLRMNNIQDGKIDYEKLKYVQSSIDDLPKLYLKEGDLLFNRTNSYELVGKSGVYHGADDVMTFASYLIRVQFSKNISNDFVNHYINSSFCRKTQLEPEIIQQNGQANFNGTKLKNIICPLPPLAEQKRIVKKLEEVLNLCEEMKTTITDNQNYTNQLLQVALKDALQMKEVEVAT